MVIIFLLSVEIAWKYLRNQTVTIGHTLRKFPITYVFRTINFGGMFAQLVVKNTVLFIVLSTHRRHLGVHID